MVKTDVEFEITKISKDLRIIQEINGRPAIQELLRLLNWPKEILNEETWLKTPYYFPIGGNPSQLSKNSNSPHVIGVVLGNSLLLTCRIHGTHGSVLTIDGKRLIDVVNLNFTHVPPEPNFALISSCVTRLETLGNKIFDIRNQIQHHLHNCPFIEFYVGGESTYSQQNGLDYMNMSFNSAIFS
jgi:hypothetical protein